MLIQCKRYKDVVGIETVKAFWSDVHFEGAESGLIATTSSVSRDSKKLCEVRKWPMNFAEATEIQHWARTIYRECASAILLCRICQKDGFEQAPIIGLGAVEMPISAG
jgi:Restriction endonuclease